MSDQQNERTSATDVDVPPAGLNTSRRKLVRAGLAAAPVVAAFKTNMVLASGTDQVVCPSTFASFKNNGHMCSVTAPKRSSGRCVPMDKCNVKGGTRHNTRKFGLGTNKNGRAGCGFRHVYQEDYHDKQLWELCAKNYGGQNDKNGWGGGRRDPGRDELARYVSAAYISCLQYGSSAFLSENQCKTIWENNGVWSPKVGGKPWSRDETIEYFEMCYGVKSFDKCLTSRG